MVAGSLHDGAPCRGTGRGWAGCPHPIRALRCRPGWAEPARPAIGAAYAVGWRRGVGARRRSGHLRAQGRPRGLRRARPGRLLRAHRHPPAPRWRVRAGSRRLVAGHHRRRLADDPGAPGGGEPGRRRGGDRPVVGDGPRRGRPAPGRPRPHLARSSGSVPGAPVGQGAGRLLRLRPRQDHPLGAPHRRGAGQVGQGPHRPHPLAARRPPRHLRGHGGVPGAEGLPQSGPHRASGGHLRLDRPPLDHRQPPAGRGGLRRRPPAPVRARPHPAARTGAGHRRDRPAPPGPGPGTGSPGRDPGDRRDARRPVRRRRGRGRRRLRRPPVPRDVILADLPRPVQEDRHAAQHGLAALADPRPVLRGRRAGDRRRLPGAVGPLLPPRGGPPFGPRPPQRGRGPGRGRVPRPGLHSLAQRGADAGGGFLAARRLLQHVSRHDARRDGAGGLRRGGSQQPLAAGGGGAVHPPSHGPHCRRGRRRPERPVVPSPRRRAGPDRAPGGRPGPGQHAGCRPAGPGRSGPCGVR